MKPSVVQLTPETFKSLVGERKNGETWLVDFYAPWCGPCNELAPDWNKLAKVLKMKHLFSYAWWNDPENDNEIDFNNDNFGGNYIFKWNNNEYSSFINNENDSDDDVRSNTNDYDNN